MLMGVVTFEKGVATVNVVGGGVEEPLSKMADGCYRVVLPCDLTLVVNEHAVNGMATTLWDSPLNADIVRCPSVNEIITRPPTANSESGLQSTDEMIDC